MSRCRAGFVRKITFPSIPSLPFLNLSPMATSFQVTNIFHVKGQSPSIPTKQSSSVSEKLRSTIRRNPSQRRQVSLSRTCCSLGVTDLLVIEPSTSNAIISENSHDVLEVVRNIKLDVTSSSDATVNIIQRISLADLDPATAKLAIGIIGPFLAAFSFLFILRVIMSWYPKLPLGKLPYVLVYAPTEPFLAPTRKVIPPLGGVDITPVVWIGLVNFLNEILVGPQGLLVLLSQKVS